LEKSGHCFSVTGRWLASDRTLPRCLVSRRTVKAALGQHSNERRNSVYDQMLARSGDLTRHGRVRSLVTVADASLEARQGRADVGARPVICDLTRLFTFWPPGKLTGVDLTWLGSASGGGGGVSGHGMVVTRARDLTQFGASSHLFSASDRSLTLHGSFSNVGDQRSTLILGDTWTSSDDRTLRRASGHFRSAHPITPRKHAAREPTALFHWGFYLSPMVSSSSLSWPFALT
jgi:hypothetical protein